MRERLNVKLTDVQPGPLRHFRPLLQTWLRLMDFNDWNRPRDAPWWYNERAVLSLFAGAVWKRGGWAFEEYSTSKRHEQTRARRTQGRYPGRGDLMFEIGRHHYVAEAKACSPSITRNGDAVKTITAVLDDSCKDAVRSPERGYRPLGIVFASPCLRATQRARCRERVQSFLRDVTQLPNVALAWTFPVRGDRVSTGGYIYPGGVVAIRPLGPLRG